MQPNMLSAGLVSHGAITNLDEQRKVWQIAERPNALVANVDLGP